MKNGLGTTSELERTGLLPVRAIEEADWPGFLETDSHAFGATMPPELMAEEREIFEPGRSIAAFDGDAVVGIATAYSFELTVPGHRLPAAGVSWVGVLPTHRRRGVLTALMRHQLFDVRDRGNEPVAILWASEPPIYGRFGYGMASRATRLTVPRSPGALRQDAPTDPRLRLRLTKADDWKATADVYAEVAGTRPGMLARDDRWWRRAVRDLPVMRDGKSDLRCVVAEDGERIRGYARYATKQDWSNGVPAGQVSVRELMAVDPAARAALYRYLFDLDLMGTVELWNAPADDPLLLWLDNIRSATPQWFDALYVRLVDVPAALSRRTYATPLECVLEVTDQLCTWNDGRWRVTGDGEDARCEATDRSPDLSLSVTDLGAAYLGGTTLADLAAAGRVVEHVPGALRAASTAFAAAPAPWCPIVF